MNTNTLKAIKKANKFLQVVEDITNSFQEECNEAVQFDVDEMNPFYQLGKITKKKHGIGCYFSLVVMQHGFNTMLYFQGKISDEAYDECKQQLEYALKEIDELANTPNSIFLH